MSEQKRKCLKCGATGSEDPKILLYRFPRPGVTNTIKCELWAKYCFPDETQSASPTFQKKLYSEHRMLCSRHFKWSAFIDIETKKLHKHAAPEEESTMLEPIPEVEETSAGPSGAERSGAGPSSTRPFERTLADITNVSRPANVRSTKRKLDSQENNQTSKKRSVRPALKSTSVNTVTQSVRKRAKTLDPKKEELYKKCRKYMKRVCSLRNALKKSKMQKKDVLHIISEDEALKKMSKYMTPTFSLLLQGEIKNFKRKFKGRRWSREEKVVALRLFKRSPTCYRLLRRMICLPSESTLKTLLAQLELNTGVHGKVLSSLTDYVKSQRPSDNTFILMFDEMSIKKHLAYNAKLDQFDGFQDHGERHGRSPVEATYALVFMLAGLRKKVKQPIAHYFSSAYVTSDRLAVLIKEVLQACNDAEICVVATVCDMDGANRRALTCLGATETQPVIKVGNQEIVTLYDTPHLLKCFRNMFLKHDIKCPVDISSGATAGRGVAKWSHIQEFYEIDNANPNFVFAPCLTKDHMNPNAKQKMKVKLAVQVLSHSVAAGMYAKISDGQLTAQATITATVCQNMDKLFDCLNSETPDLRRGKPSATNMTKKSLHTEIFQKMTKYFAEIEFVGSRCAPPSNKGWIWTMNGVQKLFEIVTKKHPDIKSLATRRMQQDPLENFFGCIRANCGSNCNPTVSQFIGGLKTAIISNLAHFTKTGNCEADGNMTIITQISQLLETPSTSTAPLASTAPTNDTDELVTEMLKTTGDAMENNIDDSGEIQACAYVCGFLIKNLKHNCDICLGVLTGMEQEVHTFISYKEYTDAKKSLKYASPEFINCVEKCATFTNEVIGTERHRKNLKKQVSAFVESKVNFDFLKRCSNHHVNNKIYIKDSVFFICVKRYSILKNREYAEESSKAALKKKIDILKHK